MTKKDILHFITAHKAELQRSYGVTRIGLFGSYARGIEVREGSDIDIVVELEKPDMFHIIGIKQFLEESLGHHVDVIRLRRGMNEALRMRIQRDAVYV